MTAKFKIVSSAEVFAAKSFSPHTFIGNPCECGHGEKQHKPLFKKQRTEGCTAPGCGCTEFQSQAEAIFAS